MDNSFEFPTYPPLFFVRFTERLRRFFLRLNRRFTHPNVILWEMIHQFWLAAGICVVAELGIADLLKKDSRTIEELASLTGTHEESLYRVLRMLASQGIFREVKGRRFISTPLATPLEEDQIRYLLLSHLTARHFQMFGDLMTTVRTGKSLAEQFEGNNLFEHLGMDEQRTDRFTRAMTGASKMQVATILSVYSFKRFSKIVDIGGGQGMLMAAILHRNEQCKGILFDIPKALIRAGEMIEAYSLGERLEVVAGDFFKRVPGGGDLYIMKNVLHDWDDEAARKILFNVHAAMAQTSRLLIIESVIDAGNKPSFGKMTDILMMVAAGGKERTREQYEQILHQTGFRIRKIHRTISPHSIIEAVKL
jgi:hypothetical protein